MKFTQKFLQNRWFGISRSAVVMLDFNTREVLCTFALSSILQYSYLTASRNQAATTKIIGIQIKVDHPSAETFYDIIDANAHFIFDKLETALASYSEDLQKEVEELEPVTHRHPPTPSSSSTKIKCYLINFGCKIDLGEMSALHRHMVRFHYLPAMYYYQQLPNYKL